MGKLRCVIGFAVDAAHQQADFLDIGVAFYYEQVAGGQSLTGHVCPSLKESNVMKIEPF